MLEFGILPWLLLALVGILGVGSAGIINRRINSLKATSNKAEDQREDMASRLRNCELDLAVAVEKSLRVDKLENEAEQYQNKIIELRSYAAKQEAAIDATKRENERHVKDLLELKKVISQELKVLTGDALKESQEQFLQIAKREFENDYERRQQAVKTLVEPIEKGLRAYQEGIQAIERKRLQEKSSLDTVLQQLVQTQEAVRGETSRLVNALRAAPQTRGRWGEETLRNVMELAGMTKHVDFDLQETVVMDGVQLRPDAIIRMPGGRRIAIDAKTALVGYLDSLEATDESEREEHLQAHARQMRQHVDLLASKEYQAAIQESPEFVAMFVPGDNFFAAATERDPELFEYAISRRVLIVTPTTLIALAKAISFGWRQESVAENARQISNLGRDLYQRLITFGSHVASIGKGLDTTVKHYNSFVGSLEERILPQARKFQDLQIETGGKSLEEPTRLEIKSREINRDRDLDFN